MPKKAATAKDKPAKRGVRPGSIRAKSGAVRAGILAELEKGKRTRAQLIAATGASMASIDAHIKALRDEGVVDLEGKYPKHFFLPKNRRAQINQDLETALAQVQDMTRLRSGLRQARRIPEKVATLEALAAVLPAAVGDVLREIRADYG